MKLKNLFIKSNNKITRTQKIVNTSIILIIILLIFIYAFLKINYSLDFTQILNYKNQIMQGILTTILISFASLILSMLIGILFTILQNSKFIPFIYISKFYVISIRNTPLLVQIFLFFYILGTAFNIENRYVLAPIILSIFSGAYITEIIRSGLKSIETKQIETSKSLGFTKFQMYYYIIIPQLIKIILPSLAGQFISLVKDSSLLSVISISEITKNIEEINSITFRVIENYIILAIIYLLLTIPIYYLSIYLEKRVSNGY